jgi:AbrB family looped-hinge helix DNA binding protein
LVCEVWVIYDSSLPSMVTTISSKGKVVLPAEFRQRDNIKAGDMFEVERVDHGEYLLRRKTASRNEGLVGLLVACPAKDWFRPLDRTESTDRVLLTSNRRRISLTPKC